MKRPTDSLTSTCLTLIAIGCALILACAEEPGAEGDPIPGEPGTDTAEPAPQDTAEPLPEDTVGEGSDDRTSDTGPGTTAIEACEESQAAYLAAVEAIKSQPEGLACNVDNDCALHFYCGEFQCGGSGVLSKDAIASLNAEVSQEERCEVCEGVLFAEPCPEPEQPPAFCDEGVCNTGWQEPFEQPEWCGGARGGPSGERPMEQDFSRAHAGIALFAPPADAMGQDAALVGMLNTDGLLSESALDELLETYASTSEHVCLLGANDFSLEPPKVEVKDNVALITPGVGAPELPAGVEGVIIDLMFLPLGADVAAAAGVALASDVSIGKREVRRFLGLPAHGDGWTHYESMLVSTNQTIEGTGAVDLPLSFRLSSSITPEAARVAGGLRMAGRAALIGSTSLHSAVAESSWSPVGSLGLLWRSSTLSYQGDMWPDVIPVDSNMKLTWTDNLWELEELAPITGPAERSAMNPYDRAAGPPSDTLDRGTMRAALVAGYGIFDWFYPYFDLVGRDLDDALLEALAEVDGLEAGDREGFMHTLGRFMHDLYDGHGFYADYSSTNWPDGYLAAQIKQVGGEPVVRFSVHEGLAAGDTITSVDGTPAAEWYEEAMSRYSAASDGYRFVLATDELTGIHGSLELGLRDVNGEERTETFAPKGWMELDAVPWGGTMRPNGWLGDLGAPNVYYLNMASSVTPDSDAFRQELSSIGQSADGIVLDMRDYPHLDIYELARHFHDTPFTAPHFGFPTWTGPEDYELTFEIWDFAAAAEPYMGPVALMVSHHSVSAAECFAQMLMDLPNVTVVGQQSASTNGTITSFWIPGNIELTYTAMRLLNLDGSDFHGIGVVPDVEVTPTAAEFAAGVDPELEAAVEAIGPP